MQNCNFIEVTCVDGEKAAVAIDSIRSFFQKTGSGRPSTVILYKNISKSNGYLDVRDSYDEVKTKIMTASGQIQTDGSDDYGI